MTRPSAIVALAFALTLALETRHATADETVSNSDRARAQELFESALADVEAGRFAAACPKFAASQQADPKTSTLLNLGSCYESLGRWASAWSAFREAQGVARKAGRPDLEAAARKRAEELAPKLVRLTVTVAEPSRVPGLVVSLDQSKLAPAEWGIGLPVDDGEHVLSAEAPERKPWAQRITIHGAGQEVVVPELARAPAPKPPASGPAPAAPSWWTPLRTTGVVLGAVGGASLVTGFVVAFVAKGNYDVARAQCAAADDCPGAAVQKGDSARSLATGGTVAIIAGAALGAAGAAFIVLAPPARRAGQREEGPRASVAIGPGSLGVGGAW